MRSRASKLRCWLQRGLLLTAMGALVILALPGCVKLPSAPPPPPPRPVTPPKPVPKPQPTPQKTPAFDTFEQIRDDILKNHEHVGSVKCAFAIGIDVSGSCHTNGVLEWAINVLSDMCTYFFVSGDKIMLAPWDSRIREKHVTHFDFTDAEAGVDALNNALENLESLVDPESRGSNVLDARGYCMTKALEMTDESGGTLCPVVLILSDTYTPDMEFGSQAFSIQKLRDLRAKLGGPDAEYEPGKYPTGGKHQLVTHLLVGTGEGLATVDGIDRTRTVAASVVAQTPVRLPTTPRRPRDYSGLRTLLMVMSLVALAGLIALPFAWKHKLVIGDARESVKAFGGRIAIQAGRGISPRGVIYLAVPDCEDRTLLTIEGKGPQLVANARRGIRLNDGRTELTIPMGRPVTLRIAIDGVPGEQVLDVQVADFFATNTGPIIGMIIALLVIVGCIIG